MISKISSLNNLSPVLSQQKKTDQSLSLHRLLPIDWRKWKHQLHVLKSVNSTVWLISQIKRLLDILHLIKSCCLCFGQSMKIRRKHQKKPSSAQGALAQDVLKGTAHQFNKLFLKLNNFTYLWRIWKPARLSSDTTVWSSPAERWEHRIVLFQHTCSKTFSEENLYELVCLFNHRLSHLNWKGPAETNGITDSYLEKPKMLLKRTRGKILEKVSTL